MKKRNIIVGKTYLVRSLMRWVKAEITAKGKSGEFHWIKYRYLEPHFGYSEGIKPSTTVEFDVKEI